MSVVKPEGSDQRRAGDDVAPVRLASCSSGSPASQTWAWACRSDPPPARDGGGRNSPAAPGSRRTDVADVYLRGAAAAHGVHRVLARGQRAVRRRALDQAGRSGDRLHSAREIVFGYLPRITAAADAGEKLRTLRSALLHSRSMTRGYKSANCETAALVAEAARPDRSDARRTARRLRVVERRRWPKEVRGEQISVVARVVNIAGYAVFFDRLGGPERGACRYRPAFGRLSRSGHRRRLSSPAARAVRRARRGRSVRPVARDRAETASSSRGRGCARGRAPGLRRRGRPQDTVPARALGRGVRGWRTAHAAAGPRRGAP